MKDSQDYSEEQARDKNRTEYNNTASLYEKWSKENDVMNQFCYFSGLDQMAKHGIEGKTFAEIGCGPCPMGQELVARGAKKIYGLDISSEMIENARNDLTKKGIIDKFDLVCADIFDHDFKLAEKVDCAVICYCMSTFINNFDTLREILS